MNKCLTSKCVSQGLKSVSQGNVYHNMSRVIIMIPVL